MAQHECLHLSAHKSDLSTQHRSIEHVERYAANPSGVLLLLKQLMCAAHYIDNALKLTKKFLERRRSISATVSKIDSLNFPYRCLLLWGAW